MTKLDKVIKGLYCCNSPNNHEECPYNGAEHYNICTHQLLNDAIDLLIIRQQNTICTKERCPVNASSVPKDCNIPTCPWRTEALKPRKSMSGLWYECPACNRHLTKDIDNYCARCGRKVKWNAVD